MLRLTCIAILLFSTRELKAQTEFLIPWEENRSVTGYSHISDSDGNIYILGTLNNFVPGPYPPRHGAFTYGSVLVKIDKHNNIVWKQVYPISYLPFHGDFNANGRIPARQLYIRNDSIFIPYNIYTGLNICKTDSTGTSSQFSTRNAVLIVDKNTGNAVRDSVFYEGPPCGRLELLYTAMHTDRGISYFYQDGLGDDSLLINDRDAQFKYTKTNKHRSSNYLSPMAFGYDSTTERYFLGDINTAYIYDRKWQLVDSLRLPMVDSLNKYDVGFRFAFNDNFIIISYYGLSYRNHSIAYTAIYTRQGTLISCEHSLPYADVLLTASNEVFCIASTNYDESDSTPLPVTFIQMDLYQNIKRKQKMGKPFVKVNKISLNRDNEIIITGTTQTSIQEFTRRPDNIYYYKQKLNDIPLLKSNKDMCGNISVYPNITTGTISITSDDFNTTYNAAVELYDTQGRQMMKTNWVSSVMSADLSQYSPGSYFIRVTSLQLSCVFTVQKQ